MTSETQAQTPLPRTQNEIVARAKEAKERDVLGFEWHEYLTALPFDAARPFLKPEASPSDWFEAPVTVEGLSHAAKEYLSFWLEKIENERGISVCRATMHYTAWKWLLGHPDADTFPGSINGGDGGWYQREAYDYIREQVESGEWDRLTQAALEVE